MTSLPFDLPTLRNHYSHFTINNKQIPVLYRFVYLFNLIFQINIFFFLILDLNPVFIIHILILILLLMNLMIVVQHGIQQKNYHYHQ